MKPRITTTAAPNSANSKRVTVELAPEFPRQSRPRGSVEEDGTVSLVS